MARSVALLRAVNVGGTGKVAMSDLRAMCEVARFERTEDAAPERQLGGRRGCAFAVRARDAARERCADEAGSENGVHRPHPSRMGQIVAGNPFPEEAKSDPSHLLVMLRKTAPTAAHLAALAQLNDGPEKFVARGRELYVTFPEGMGRSRFAAVLSREKVGGPGTGRNWNTVLKLASLLGE